MNRSLREIARKTIVKVSFFNALSVLLRLIFAFISNKVIAVYLGPIGTTFTGQMQNFVQALQGFSTLGINEGIIKYASLYEQERKKLVLLLRTAYKIALSISLLLMIIIIILAPQINDFLFPGNDFTILIYTTAILLPFYAYHIILMAVLNGFQQYKRIVFINILIHFTGMVLTVLFTIRLMMTGALLSVVITPALGLFIIIWLLRDDRSSILILPFGKTGKRNFKRLFPFILMALISAIFIPLFTIFIRTMIIENLDKEHAGYWDAIRKISAFYFMFITPVFSMYYFPRLSKINGKIFLWKDEIMRMITHFYPFIFSGFLIIYFFRRFFTQIIFSEAYTPMNDLYFWQLTGDAIRLFSLLLAYKMWVRVLVNKFVLAEITYWILFYFLGKFLISTSGILGIMYAYVISNFYYLLLMFIYFGKDLKAFGKKH